MPDTIPLSGPVFNEPVFNEKNVTPDPSGFEHLPDDSPVYNELGDTQTTNVVSFDSSGGDPEGSLELAKVYGSNGASVVKAIEKSGQISFHAVGDTGATTVGKYASELAVADRLAADCQASGPASRPAFFFHLGDLVYNFGEAEYYYDQFYDPYRNYPGPIFALPGNHDSFVVPGTQPADAPLEVFKRNFCASQPEITPEAGSVHRTAMIQPGVYFTLNAPFVRIIGLFSNALENPGVISSENGRWPAVPDFQLAYLQTQLALVAKQKYTGAVLLAVHHPPFSYSPPPKTGGRGGNAGGSPAMLRQIDAICKTAGVYPHAFLCGHAHNYQRYTRTIAFNGRQFEVPFVVAGNGGHNVTSLLQGRNGVTPAKPDFGAAVDYLESKPAVSTKSLVLEKYDETNYGYLTVTVNAHQLDISYNQVGDNHFFQPKFDRVTIDLATHRRIAH